MTTHPDEYDPPGSISCNGCPRLREKWRNSYATCPGCERLAEARGETDDEPYDADGEDADVRAL